MGGGSRGDSSSKPQLPPQVNDLMNASVPQQEAVLQQAPLQSFATPNPQGVAGFTPEQQQALGTLTGVYSQPGITSGTQSMLDAANQSLLGPVANQQQLTGAQYLQQLVSGNQASPGDLGQAFAPGQQPANPTAGLRYAALGQQPGQGGTITDALEGVYQTRTLPELQSQMSLAGLGNSSQVARGVADARAQFAGAVAPYLLQEQGQRQAGAQQLYDIGTQLQNLPAQRAAQGLQLSQAALQQAAGPGQNLYDLGEQSRQLEQQKQDALYNDFLRRQAMTEGITNTVTGQVVPSAIGVRSTQKTTGPGLAGLFTGQSK
jgi:hypothetical protein